MGEVERGRTWGPLGTMPPSYPSEELSCTLRLCLVITKGSADVLALQVNNHSRTTRHIRSFQKQRDL